MAIFYSDLRTNTVANPPVKNQVNKHGGRVRYLQAVYTAPATGTPQIADTIEWATLPKSARLASGSKLFWSTGTAASTINLGDAASPARYMAATAITTAGSGSAEAHLANGGVFETTGEGQVISTVAGAAIAANQVITAHLYYTLD